MRIKKNLARKNFIHKISASYCNALNKDTCNISKNVDYYYYLNLKNSDYYYYLDSDPDHPEKLHIIKENMMEGEYFSSKKTCEFLCDKSKHYEIKLALNKLIDLDMGLFEYWKINPRIKDIYDILLVDIMRFYEIYDI
jgi:hypothetical protein